MCCFSFHFGRLFGRLATAELSHLARWEGFSVWLFMAVTESTDSLATYPSATKTLWFDFRGAEHLSLSHREAAAF